MTHYYSEVARKGGVHLAICYISLQLPRPQPSTLHVLRHRLGTTTNPRSPHATLSPRLYSGPGFSFSLSGPVFNPLLRGSVLRSGGPTGAPIPVRTFQTR